MLFQTVTASLALIGSVVAAPTWSERQDPAALVARQVPVLQCSHLTGGVHVIAVGGSGLAPGGDPKTYGYLGSLATSILNAIPGSTNVSVPYDKVTTRTNPNAIPGGMSTFAQYVSQYHHYCPHTKIVTIGYSAGAVIAMNSQCGGGVSPSLAGNTIIATVVYGDETRVAGQPYDLGTCTTGYGHSPRQNPAACGAFIPNMQSYCEAGDEECCLPNGNDPNAHFVYPTKYDAAATAFVVKKFKQYGV